MPFEEKVPYQWMSDGGIPEKYREKKLKLQRTSVVAYRQGRVIPKDHCASAFCTTVDVKFLCRFVCAIAALFEPFLLLPSS